jgi:hypothetical protein
MEECCATCQQYDSDSGDCVLSGDRRSADDCCADYELQPRRSMTRQINCPKCGVYSRKGVTEMVWTFQCRQCGAELGCNECCEWPHGSRFDIQRMLCADCRELRIRQCHQCEGFVNEDPTRDMYHCTIQRIGGPLSVMDFPCDKIRLKDGPLCLRCTHRSLIREAFCDKLRLPLDTERRLRHVCADFDEFKSPQQILAEAAEEDPRQEDEDPCAGCGIEPGDFECIDCEHRDWDEDPLPTGAGLAGDVGHQQHYSLGSAVTGAEMAAAMQERHRQRHEVPDPTPQNVNSGFLGHFSDVDTVNAYVQNRGLAAPVGSVYYDTTTQTLRMYDGIAWLPVGGATPEVPEEATSQQGGAVAPEEAPPPKPCRPVDPTYYEPPRAVSTMAKRRKKTDE